MFEPLCVKTTSEAPKSLPLVHHLPSIEAGIPLAGPPLGLLVFGVVFAGDFGGVLDVVVGVGRVSDVLPPEGWADACAARATIVTVAVATKRKACFPRCAMSRIVSSMLTWRDEVSLRSIVANPFLF
jgi:uncharacterized membrane protein YeiH